MNKLTKMYFYIPCVLQNKNLKKNEKNNLKKTLTIWKQKVVTTNTRDTSAVAIIYSFITLLHPSTSLCCHCYNPATSILSTTTLLSPQAIFSLHHYQPPTISFVDGSSLFLPLTPSSCHYCYYFGAAAAPSSHHFLAAPADTTMAVFAIIRIFLISFLVGKSHL